MRRYAQFLLAALLAMILGSLAQAAPWDKGFITIDHIQGLANGDTVLPGSDLRFILRYRNDSTKGVGISNGFRVFSPDGATWDSTRADSLGYRPGDPTPGVAILGKTQFDLGLFINSLNIDGIGADTVGILGLNFVGPGLMGPFNDTVLSVTVHKINLLSGGRHICVDSAWFRPAGSWKWAGTGSFNRFPTWYAAPRCFSIKGSAPPDTLVHRSITLDHVQGALAGDTVTVGSSLRFVLRYRNDSTKGVGISNGFRVFSPDGAIWDSTIADTLGWRPGDATPGKAILGRAQFDIVSAITRYSSDGLGADTIGLLGAMFQRTGLPGGFNDTAYAITALNIRAGSEGKHICLDSSWFRPGGTWKWAGTAGFNRIPEWSGLRCYLVKAKVVDSGGRQEISVDHVQGAEPGDSVSVGSSLRFVLRYKNDSTRNLSIVNGFRIYSPDGARWDSTRGDSLGWRPSDPTPGVAILGGQQFDLVNIIAKYSADGADVDTISIAGIRALSTGLPSGFNDTAYSVTAFNIRPGSEGKRICIDSSWFDRNNPWMWTGSSGLKRYPAWSGSRCYYIKPRQYDSVAQRAIVVDHVQGVSAGDSVAVGSSLRFVLRYMNDSTESFYGMTNGFRIYSPDGATWDSTRGDSLGWRPTDPSPGIAILGKTQFDLISIIGGYSLDGMNVDTILFGAARLNGIGLSRGFNDTAFAISAFNIHAGSEGKRICIDSASFVRPGAPWMWVGSTRIERYPEWIGAKCYYIKGPERRHVIPTDEWISLYCDSARLNGRILRLGSVISVIDPNGVTCGEGVVGSHGSYGFLNVYHDDLLTPNLDEGAQPGDKLSFRIDGEPVFSDRPVFWTMNGDRVPVCWFSTQRCIPLRTGWNLISWNVDTPIDSVPILAAEIMPNVDVILGFEGEGLTYDPKLPLHSNLTRADHLHGFWFKMKQYDTLCVSGPKVPVGSPIDLEEGWNLASYLPDVTMTPAQALASISRDLLFVYGFDAYGHTAFTPTTPTFNTLDSMRTQLGYWMKVSRNTTLTYPWGLMVTSALKPPTSSRPKLPFAPTMNWVNAYAHQLTLDGAVVPSGTRVIARSVKSGAIVGAGTVGDNGKFGFMPVYGADMSEGAQSTAVGAGEKFTFEVGNAATTETFTWTGTGENVELTNLTARAGASGNLPASFWLAQNYPNPFNPKTTIQFGLPSASDYTLVIFNVTGQRVAEFSGSAEAGTNSVVWDATSFASGIYFYRVNAGSSTATKKMLLLK